MHISKVVRRVAAIGFSMLSFVFLFGATFPAFAVDPTGSIVTNFPANTSVGDSFSASIVITNTGTCPPDCDDWDPQFDGEHAVWTIPLRVAAPVAA